MMIGMKLDMGHGPPALAEKTVRSLRENFFVIGSIFNGFSAAYFVMHSLWVHILFFDSISGWGSNSRGERCWDIPHKLN